MTATVTRTSRPGAFDRDAYPDAAPAPLRYRGPEFDLELVRTCLEPTGGGVIVLGKPVAAVNVTFDQPAPHPVVYFEVAGSSYHYVVSAFADRFEMEVCRPDSFERFSSLFPVTETQLRAALETIVSDAMAKWIKDHQRA